jgi:hypothetical protein
MGRTIQFESQRVELWAIYAMERDDDVLEYYDQPMAVPLRYRTPSGRMTTQWHVPDFFVLRRNGASFEEWTSASALAARTRRMPGRYQEEQRIWRCPPGEAYATPLGLGYQIRSSASLRLLAVQNFSFLQDYWAHPAPVTAAEEELVLATVETMPGISVAEVLATHPGLVVDVVWALLATGWVFTDLSVTSLMHHDQVALYRDEPAWRQAAEQAAREEQPRVFPELVLWDKRLWQVEARPADTRVYARLDYYRQVLSALREHVAVKDRLMNLALSAKPSRHLRDAAEWLDMREANVRRYGLSSSMARWCAFRPTRDGRHAHPAAKRDGFGQGKRGRSRAVKTSDSHKRSNPVANTQIAVATRYLATCESERSHSENFREESATIYLAEIRQFTCQTT